MLSSSDGNNNNEENKINYQGYIKIDSSNSQWELDNKQHKLFKKTKWAITEKVHGSNFCFYTSRNSENNEIVIVCGKRKQLLSKDEVFYNAEDLKNENHLKLEQIFIHLEKEIKDLKSIHIYGELFGGYYPSSLFNENNNSEHNAVQTGIYYCNNISFMAFDILLNLNNNTNYFLDFEKSIELFKKVNLFYAIPLFTGTFEECLEYNIKFNSTIPKYFNMPPLEVNYAEGIVIKPLKEICVMKKGKVERAILKRKIEEFSEKKYDQAKKWDNNNNNGLTTSNNNEEQNLKEMIRYEGLACITKNRLVNALSKIGKVNIGDKKQMNELLDMFVNDVIDELKELREYNEITKDSKEEIKNEIVVESKKLIAKYFKEQQQLK
ncbi:hypothetical protein ABK040_000393 [Willaertia magna]